jgi:hypothetical protein
MNKQQQKKLLARRECACDSFEHCCESVRDFEARVGVVLKKKR